jgi:hypothetical protein
MTADRSTSSVAHSREVMRQSESRLAATFAVDAGDDLSLADEAAALLMAVILRAAPERVTVEVEVADDGSIKGDVRACHLAAQLFIGIRAFRAMRASQSVLAYGYEIEARALDRIIIELLAHRKAINDDASGAEAIAWLQGERAWGISKRVNAVTPKDLYKNLSHDSHGDPVGVERLYDSDSDSVVLSPTRTKACRATLLMHAGFARDQAVAISRLAGFELGGIDALTTAIRRRWGLLEDSSGQPPPPETGTGASAPS